MVILILCSEADDASVNLRGSLLESSSWEKAEFFQHGKVNRNSNCNVHLLTIEKIHVDADSIDEIHENEVGCVVNEVLVLSRHVSSSDTPAITLHAIGLPGSLPEGAPGRSGGVNGVLVPPSPRFACLYREMVKEARKRNLQEHFDLTLEATHHGPVLTRPTLYIEIGSTESDWSRDDALELWAKVLCRVLGLNGDFPKGIWEGSGEVMIGLGGGHYAPRHKDIVERGGMWLGHVLANYSLDFTHDKNPDSEELLMPWQRSIISAINSTMDAFPGGDIFVHLDRKSFKGWQRTEINSFLSENDILVLRGRDILREQP
tara:strand:- start:665 stop:1615 length:951 start_codon:yes stop_codon:yes gene_type:complete